MILTIFDHTEVAHEVFTSWVGSQQCIHIIKKLRKKGPIGLQKAFDLKKKKEQFS